MVWKSWILTYWPNISRWGGGGVKGVCGQNIYRLVAAFMILFILICNMTMFWKSWPIDPIPRVVWGGSTRKIFATMMLHSWFSLVRYASRPHSEKSWTLIYWPHPKSQGCLKAKYLLPCCCIRDSLNFDMQHVHVLKKLNFDLLTPSPGSGGGVSGSQGKIFASMLLHLWFSLIWYASCPCSEKVEFDWLTP